MSRSCMHDIQTVRITFQPNCNHKHMYQHLMYWLDSYAGHAESAVQFIWHTNLCIPSRTGIRTKRTAIQTIRTEKHTTCTILAIQTIRGPDDRKVCIKGFKTYEFVTRFIIKYIQFIYTRKYAFKMYQRGRRLLRNVFHLHLVMILKGGILRLVSLIQLRRRSNIPSPSILLLQFLMRINLTMPAQVIPLATFFHL